MFLIPKVEKIRQYRTNAGLSMQALSHKARLPNNAILRIERGKSTKTNKLRADEIAKALGCKTSDIFTENRKGI